MELKFINPGMEYMIKNIMEFQKEESSAFWSEPLFHFYPQINKQYALTQSYENKTKYIRECMENIYPEIKNTIDETIISYSEYWGKYKAQITEALTEAFGVNCSLLFNDMMCNVTMNPICPRFLEAHSFDIFHLNSEKGALGTAIHEMIHFVWFYVWNELFHDSYGEYETPSLKWILSEMVVESIMKDSRLSSINPYFPRENGGCVYPYFFNMEIEGELVLNVLDDMYKNQDIKEFMKNSYSYCLKYEEEIRKHIKNAESSE